MIMSMRRRKFNPDCDYDSDPECIKKEKVKMLSDLTKSINKFSTGNPLIQIENLGEDRWCLDPTSDCQDASVEQQAANEERR